MMNLGFSEILLILVIVLLVFGASAIPNIGKSLGEGIREFKKAQSEESKPKENKAQENKDDKNSPEDA